MSDKSRIEWTDATWTPIRARRRDTGKVGVHCERVSPACANCYAATFNRRNLPAHGTGLDFIVPNREKVEIFMDEKMLLAPLRWKRRRKIFVCSQTDLFGEFITDEMINRVFAVMALCPQHTFQVLTKRPERMQAYLTADFLSNRIFNCMQVLTPKSGVWSWPGMKEAFKHIWLGVTAENQEWADKRIPLLLQTPAAKRFVSVEPMLGPVDLTRGYVIPNGRPVDFLQSRGCVLHADGYCLGWCKGRWPSLDWVICGGESGHGARPMRIEWAESLNDQCKAAGVPFFMKQLGVGPIWAGAKSLPIYPARGKNDVADEWPVELRVREFPEVSL